MPENSGLAVSHIESPRLRLVAATQELLKADLQGAGPLSLALGINASPGWPPELYDRLAVEYTQRQLLEPAEHGWSTWYLVGKDPSVLVGVCGFKGRPDAAGSVEISYSILAQLRTSGFATEAVGRLVEWAFSHVSVNEVCAETLPHLAQSIRVLEKNGFSKTGQGSEYGVIRYALARQALD